MIQTITEKSCLKCGADIRPDTQFCYNCGNSLEIETLAETDEKLKKNSNGIESEEKIKEIKEVKATGSRPKLNQEQLKERRQQKLKKQTEIIWEEHNNPPNLLFVVGAILLALIAVGLVYAMLYIR